MRLKFYSKVLTQFQILGFFRLVNEHMVQRILFKTLLLRTMRKMFINQTKK
jgi:hypothetical protein